MRGLAGARKARDAAPMERDWDAIWRELAQQLGEGAALLLEPALLRRFAEGIRSGRYSRAANAVQPAPVLAGEQDVEVAEDFDARHLGDLESRGREAIAAGRVAIAVLNGGMATRFGGDVKGIVPAVGSRTFLEIKLAQADRLGPVPLLIMNSFATHARTLAFLRERGLEERVECFLQFASLRFTPEGEPFRGADGRLSPHAPGHGDFPFALCESGLLRKLRARGVELVLLSNIDNLGAELEPWLVGYHLAHGRPITAELARAVPGDAGGAPAFVGGRLQIVEGFRFPPGFDARRVPFLATNTFLFSLDVLAQPRQLSWFYVEKEVENRTAVQMERLVNELTAFHPTAYLATPRAGPNGRFFPIKSRQDLDALRADPELVARFSRT
jgi:UTP--glucose-1-phosphate uridylyltransferase